MTSEHKKQFIRDALHKLEQFFDDTEKAEKWLYIKNPYFGYESPIHMYKLGKGQEVLDFIDTALNEYDL